MESSLLKQIADNTEKTARNTEPKTSITIDLYATTTRIRSKLNPPLELDKNKNYEIALIYLATYYSFPNIDETNNNFTYSPDDVTDWITIKVPVGCYEITDINNRIQKIMKESGHYDATNGEYCISIHADSNTLKSVVTIAGSYRVNFRLKNSIGSVLGFKKEGLPFRSGSFDSEEGVNITTVNKLLVMNDIIGSSYINGSKANLLHSFAVDVGPGYQIIEKPVILLYRPITLSTISTMTTMLLDQNEKQINLRGEVLAIRLHIREV